MFKNLMGFWKGKEFISQIFDEFNDMLNKCEFMFKSVTDHLLENREIPDLKEKIYATDKKVNIQQRTIRKRIVEHLTLQPSVEFTVSLVMMSVVKDAERLGDYCKNVYEVTELLDKPMSHDLYVEYFNGLDQEILKLFEQTRSAFLDADEDKAKLAWQAEQSIGKGCDAIIHRLAQCDLSVNEAVCFTLLARHYKRLIAHLVNIATAAILPLNKMDFFDEKRGRGDDDETEWREAISDKG